MSEGRKWDYAVDARRCIRCGACATVSGGQFKLERTVARVARPPTNSTEEAACEAARLLCPVSAIRRTPAQADEERSPS
jgi:ferredoxin